MTLPCQSTGADDFSPTGEAVNVLEAELNRMESKLNDAEVRAKDLERKLEEVRVGE